MTTFKKNQEVTFLQNWDAKGTVRIVDLVVYSCGRKQMVLVDADGKTFAGHWFRPTEEQAAFGRVVPRLSPQDAQAAAIELGAAIVQHERNRMEHCIASYGYGENHGYTKAVRSQIAALHEPRATIS